MLDGNEGRPKGEAFRAKHEVPRRKSRPQSIGLQRFFRALDNILPGL